MCPKEFSVRAIARNWTAGGIEKRPCPRPWPNMCQWIHRLWLEAGWSRPLADQLASVCPDRLCIGIDLIAGRIEKANAKKYKRNLPLLYFIKAELNEFLEVLAPAVRFQAVVFCSQIPGPKARHHKKRMIQFPLLEASAERMAEGGALYFRTDDRSDCVWTEEHFAESPYWQIARERSWLHEEATYFQDLMDGYYSLVAEPIAAD